MSLCLSVCIFVCDCLMMVLFDGVVFDDGVVVVVDCFCSVVIFCFSVVFV